MWYGDKRESMVNLSTALSIEGWKIYGFRADESDSMTDYYSPAWWQGIASKNGYTLIVDNATTSYSGYEIKETRYSNNSYKKTDAEKIQKLRNMTVSNGASPQEEESAIKSIQKIQDRQDEGTQTKVIDTYPTFKNGNPDNYNWHLEDQNGIIIAMGTGVFQFSNMPQNWNFETRQCREGFYRSYQNEDPTSYQDYYLQDEDKVNKVSKFYKLVDKINSTIADPKNCMTKKEVVKSTEVVKVVKLDTTELQEGLYIRLNSNFSQGCSKGMIYKIMKVSDTWVQCYKMNGKLNKVLTGQNSFNTFNCNLVKINKWISECSIEIVDIQTVTESETVIKWVKDKYINMSKVDTSNMITSTETAPEPTMEEVKTVTPEPQTDVINNEYTITEDVDTRDNSKIYVVKYINKLSKEEYIKVAKYIDTLGGYYSKFKHGFIFKENPADLLNIDVQILNDNEQETQVTDDIKEPTKPQQQQAKVKEPEPIKVDINFNTNKKTIELSIENLTDDVTQAIKKIGFREFKGVGLWIAQDTPERKSFINEYFKEHFKESA